MLTFLAPSMYTIPKRASVSLACNSSISTSAFLLLSCILKIAPLTELLAIATEAILTFEFPFTLNKPSSLVNLLCSMITLPTSKLELFTFTSGPESFVAGDESILDFHTSTLFIGPLTSNRDSPLCSTLESSINILPPFVDTLLPDAVFVTSLLQSTMLNVPMILSKSFIPAGTLSVYPFKQSPTLKFFAPSGHLCVFVTVISLLSTKYTESSTTASKLSSALTFIHTTDSCSWLCTQSFLDSSPHTVWK